MTKSETCYLAFEAGLLPAEVCRQHPEIGMDVARIYHTRWKDMKEAAKKEHKPRHIGYREEAYQLFEEGHSSATVSRKLGIGYTTARRHHAAWEAEQQQKALGSQTARKQQIRCCSGAVFDKTTKTDTIWR